MHLLLLIPSTALLLLLLLHCLHYRGWRTAAGFFPACLAFGVLRGNLIHYVITGHLGGESLPYLFTRPVLRIGQASLQECIGWMFALYLNWSLAERLLGRRGRPIPLFRLVALVCALMGALSYAVEAAATGMQWWVWVIPVRNPYWWEVPFVGIIAWISVGFDFFLPYLALRHGLGKGIIRYLPLLFFPLHMLTHLKITVISGWLPLNPAELWHWLMLCALFVFLFFGGPPIEPENKSTFITGPLKLFAENALSLTTAGFLSVLLAAHGLVIRRPEGLISLLPFLTALLAFLPHLAWVSVPTAVLLFGAVSRAWSLTLAPGLSLLLFSAAGLEMRLPRRFALRTLLVSLTLTVAGVVVYGHYRARNERNLALIEAGERLARFADRLPPDLSGLLPPYCRPEDAYLFNRMGVELSRKGLVLSGTVLLHKALECDSTYAYAWFNLAGAYRMLGHPLKATDFYERGLALNPVNVEARLRCGGIYRSLGMTEDAWRVYRRALKYDPENESIKKALAGLLESSGGSVP